MVQRGKGWVRITETTCYEPKLGRLARVLRCALKYAATRHIFRIFIIGATLWAITRLDIMGTQSATDNLAHDFVMQIGAWVFWPEHDPLRGPGVTQSEVARAIRAAPGETGVTLFVWTDEAMETLVANKDADQVWPIGYQVHADTLLAALDLGAKAVFLDFVFPTQRGTPGSDHGWAQFRDVLMYDVPSYETRVFIACDPQYGGPSAFPEFIEAVRAGNEEGGANPNNKISFVPATIASQPVVRQYELMVDVPANPARSEPVSETHATLDDIDICAGTSDRAGSTQSHPARLFPSVAATLYREAVRREAKGDTPPEAPHEAGNLSLTGHPLPMSLFWDRRTHVITETFFDETNAAPEALYALVRQWLTGIFIDKTVLDRDLPGPPIVPADYLFDAAFAPVDVAHDQTSDTVTIKDLVHDRIVIIGSAQKSAADFRNSPNAAQIPGALVHTVAVDNLLQFGADYIKDQPLHAYFQSLNPIKPGNKATSLVSKALGSLGAARTSDIILILVLIVSAATYSIMIEDKSRSRGIEEFIKAHTKPIIKRLLIASVIGAAAIFISGLSMLYLRLPPSQWLTTLLAFTFVGAPFVLALVNTGVMAMMYTKHEVREVEQSRGFTPYAQRTRQSQAIERPANFSFQNRLSQTRPKLNGPRRWNSLLRSSGSTRRKPTRGKHPRQ